MPFISVEVADHQVELVNVEDISRVKVWDVRLSKDRNEEVRGCIIERRSSEGHAVWCVEPQKVIIERVAEVEAIAGPKEWTP